MNADRNDESQQSGSSGSTGSGSTSTSGDVSTASSGGTNWVGWILIIAIIFMMGAAVLLSVQRMREVPAAPGPTSAPKPKIGSMVVDTQVDPTGEVSSGETDSADAGRQSPSEADGDALAAEVNVDEEASRDGNGGDAPVDVAEAMVESRSAVERADTAVMAAQSTSVANPVSTPGNGESIVPQGPNLLLASGLADILAEAVVAPRFDGVKIVPTATDVTRTAAFGRVRARDGVTRTVEPTETEAPTVSRSELLTATEAPTQTPVPTVTPTVTWTPAPSATSSATPTLVPTVTSTATPVPSDTPEPTSTETSTPSSTPTETITPSPTPTETSISTPTPTDTLTPTSTATVSATPTPTTTPTVTETAVPTATNTPAPTPTVSIEDLPVQLPPGSIVVGNNSNLGMYLEASSAALIMATYIGGTKFNVLEPVSPFDSYPVLVDGIAWLRVRAEDGLVGWIDAAFVALGQ